MTDQATYTITTGGAGMSEAKARALAMADRLEVMAKGLEQAGLIMQAKANRKKAAEIREANK